VLGPIIRISPREVHISDPDFYEKIYHIGTQYGKDEWFYQVGLGPAEFFITPDNARHKVLREPLNPFFSRRNVIETMQESVLEELGRFEAHLQKLIAGNETANLDNALRCISTDVISRTCWGIDEDMISQKGFSPAKVHDLQSLPQNLWPRILFPNVTRIMNMVPPKYVIKMNKEIGAFFNLVEVSLPTVLLLLISSI
jgi:cytochrome P450